MPRYPRLAPAAEGLSSQVYTSLLDLARESGNEVFALNVGDTHLEPPACGSVDALPGLRFPGMHRYAEVRGEPALLDAIVAELGRRDMNVPRAQLQVTTGGTSALDLACRTLLTPGDDVLLLAPYWPLIRGILSACGARAIEVPLFTELRRPDFDPEATLERALTPRTSAIYVNSPNNPTGVVLDATEVAVLARFIEKHDLWLLSDEAYERLSYVPERPRLWQVPSLAERTVVMHTFSKTYGMAGARVAYLHAAPSVIERLAGLQTFATYCAPRPLQIAMSRVLESDEGETFVESARSLYRDLAARTADTLAIERPDAGTFAFFDLRPLCRNGELPHLLLERAARAGVVLTPGAATGAAYADWARLCFTAVEPSALDRALAALRAVIYD